MGRKVTPEPRTPPPPKTVTPRAFLAMERRLFRELIPTYAERFAKADGTEDEPAVELEEPPRTPANKHWDGYAAWPRRLKAKAKGE